MTEKQFEQAVELREKIESLYILQDVIKSAKPNGTGKRFLASIDVTKFGHSEVLVDECKVLNHAHLSEDVMEKFDRIIWDELNLLQDAFKKL